MKTLLSLVILLNVGMIAFAQKVISRDEYKGNFNGSVSVTNDAFPFIFSVVKETYSEGKVVSIETEVAERQAQGVERETKTITKDGKTRKSFSIMVGFDKNTYCSSDGKVWNGPQEYVCPSPDQGLLTLLSGPRTPESAMYTVTDKKLSGKSVKVYREYAVYASEKGQKTFEETLATIDANGYFIEVLTTEGTLAPRVVTLTQKETWTLNAKFAPVVAPK